MLSLLMRVPYNWSSIARYASASAYSQESLNSILYTLLKYIWCGISVCGATRRIMFSGIMNGRLLAMILEAGLLPFIAESFQMVIIFFMTITLHMQAILLKISFIGIMLIGGLFYWNLQI